MTHFSGGAQALYHAFGEQILKEIKWLFFHTTK